MILVPVVFLAPFVAAMVGFAVGGRSRTAARALAVLGAAAALVVALVAALQVWGGAGQVDVWATVPTGGIQVAVATRADGLGLTVAVMVAAVALAVQVYSTTYLREDHRYSSYAALVSLFTAAMLLVVVADDLIVLLVGWEVMGICSYFLIGHYWELRAARAAAVKAFVVTRLGDIGFLFGIFTLGSQTGSFQVSRLQGAIGDGAVVSSTTITVGTLLVLAGVVGKSAQVPLHVWLPDAMAGPTPISALIHAATMVAAGVFLVARLYDVMLLAPTTLAVLAVIASVTMLGTALAALAQDDLKRVLAYSTSSQLAYMLGGLAVGGYAAGLLHLLTHAAFKALLFLCAGAVIHAVGSNLLGDMGGLRRGMPVTFWTMTVGFLALAGVPPLSGFFSKESILGAAEHAALSGGPLPAGAAWLVLLTGLATVLVTATYVTRAWLMTFFGPRRVPATPPAPPARASAGPAHDPDWAMGGPLVGLAGAALALGVLVFAPDALAWAFSGTPGAAGERPESLLSAATATISLLLVAAGFTTAHLQWWRAGQRDPAVALGPARPVFAAAFGIDRLYDDLVVRPVRALARLTVSADRDVVHAYVTGVGRSARGLGRLVRLAQVGWVQAYLAALLIGVVLLATAGVMLA